MSRFDFQTLLSQNPVDVSDASSVYTGIGPAMAKTSVRAVNPSVGATQSIQQQQQQQTVQHQQQQPGLVPSAPGWTTFAYPAMFLALGCAVGFLFWQLMETRKKVEELEAKLETIATETQTVVRSELQKFLEHLKRSRQSRLTDADDVGESPVPAPSAPATGSQTQTTPAPSAPATRSQTQTAPAPEVVLDSGISVPAPRIPIRAQQPEGASSVATPAAAEATAPATEETTPSSVVQSSNVPVASGLPPPRRRRAVPAPAPEQAAPAPEQAPAPTSPSVSEPGNVERVTVFAGPNQVGMTSLDDEPENEV